MDEPTAARTRNVKKRQSESASNPGIRTPHRLERTTFRTSRIMDFFSQKELVTQIGHDVSEWPCVIAKELVDNALDAGDEADVPPVITITADATGITVSDNGPGLPESTLAGALDYSVRTSNREAYVAPDRGAQGNALKTLIPMPYVLDPDHGRVLVTAHGKRHVITCGVDPVSRHPVIRDDASACPTTGTSIRLEWGPEQGSDGDAVWPFARLRPDDAVDGLAQRFQELVTGFALFNPHATFRLDWFGTAFDWPATDPQWRKWRPHQPTSAHWYEQRHLERLIGAYVTHDREHGGDRLVSDLVREFDGLSGSRKQARVLADSGLHRVRLSELVHDGGFDTGRIRNLLHAMQQQSRPVTPARLGFLGEEHLRTRLLDLGVRPESFRYSRRTSPAKCKDPAAADTADTRVSVPWVLESAFGWKADDDEERSIFAGTNWSAALGNPFRTFGDTGEGLETVLADMRATRYEPIVFVLHLAHPRLEFTDRGKSALVIGGTT